MMIDLDDVILPRLMDRYGVFRLVNIALETPVDELVFVERRSITVVTSSPKFTVLYRGREGEPSRECPVTSLFIRSRDVRIHVAGYPTEIMDWATCDRSTEREEVRDEQSQP